MNRPECAGGVGSPADGRYHLRSSPRVRPAPPTHPRKGPIGRAGGRDRGSKAPLAERRAGGRTDLGHLRGRPCLCQPPAFPSEVGPGLAAPPLPRPGWAGRLGLRELGWGRASSCFARARRARAQQPPTQQRSPLPSPETRGLPGGPGESCVRACEAVPCGPHAPPAAPRPRADRPSETPARGAPAR